MVAGSERVPKKNKPKHTQGPDLEGRHGGLFKLGNTTLAANDVVSQNRYTVSNDFQYGIYGDYVLAVDSTGNNLQLTFTPVPEPGTMVALGAVGLGLLGAPASRLPATRRACPRRRVPRTQAGRRA